MAKPTAIPATPLSDVLTPKPDKDIQNKSENFAVQSSDTGDISNHTTSPKEATNNIFKIPKELEDFHSKINQELKDIRDQYDIRLINI
eukprot:8934060-Ditylum_brightwellii.AAC.2